MGLERTRLLTESYKATEGEEWVIRRAKALDHILRNMTVYIQNHERIVGNYAAAPNELHFPIELNWKSYLKAVNSEVGRSLLTDEGRTEFKTLCNYWNGKALRDIQLKYFAGVADLEKYFKYDGTFMWNPTWYEMGLPNYEKLFRIGLNGVIAEAKARLEEIKRTIPANYLDQKDFLEAVIITLRAAIAFAGRYAELARELAVKEANGHRKKELETIARACGRVPANPPRTLQEAIQSFWFYHLITRQIELVDVGIGIRFDLLMGTFYAKDKQEGRIDRDDALDLLQRLWLKIEEMGMTYGPMESGVYGGIQSLNTLVIGGVDREGKDVTNEMSYLVLDTAEIMRSAEPNIGLRVHGSTPKELLSRATDVIRTGVGYPSLFNDDAIIPLLLRWGVSFEEAREYSLTGCVYITIPGSNHVRHSVGYASWPKYLWWALHQGVDPKTGEQRRARTPDPSNFTCLEDVIQAYLAQARFFFGKQVQLDLFTRRLYKRYLPRPFTSALVDGAIERGQDFRQFDCPNGTANMVVIVGATNVADSLAAIKWLVFEKKMVSMKEFLEVLDRNWEGREDLRQIVLSQVPKFGNDDDYVDTLAREVHIRTEQVIEEFADDYGGPFHADGSGVSATYGMAADCGATPDGRRDGEPFADGSLSPMLGRDTKGPTAVLSSVSKIEADLRHHTN